jgi:polysaccharide biosynthesis transport protein
MSNAMNDPVIKSVHSSEVVRTSESETRSYMQRDSEYSWEQAVRVLRKNRKFALALAGGLTLLILVGALLMKNSFQPVARLDIEPPTSGIKTLHEIESTADAENEDYLETQVQILKSDALAVSVIRELKLDKAASNDAVSGQQGQNDSKQNPGARPGDTSSSSSPYLREQLQLATLSPAESKALDKFRRNLSVSTIHNTRLVEISYASNDAKEAQRVTNVVVARFIDNGYKQRYTTTMQMSAWLSSQLNELRQKLEASNQAVSDYQKKYGLIELDDHDVPMSQLMSEVNHQLSDAQANRIESEAFARMVEMGQTDSIPQVRDNQVYQNLTLRYADLRAQLAQAKTVYGDANSNVKKLEEQASETARQIDAERARIAERLRTSFAAAKEREKLMLRSREKLRKQMGAVSSQIVGYHLLKNDAIANAELYNTLQGRLQEAGIYAGLKATNIRVVDLATNLQKPTAPNRPLLVTGGAFFSCIFAVFACFMRESLNNTVRTPDDIKSWIGLRSLAQLPVINSEVSINRSPKSAISEWLHPRVDVLRDSAASDYTLMKPLSMEAEAMRDLRTALLSSRAQALPQIILISSSMEGEGKTTVATNFAIALSQLGRTCLIDADLRRPAVTRAFAMNETVGLSEVLSGTVQLAEILVPVSKTPNLWILPSGQSAESPADVLASDRINKLCRELRAEFNYVVIDSPPVIRFSDARFLSQFADEVVLVGRYGVTTRRALQRSVELLREIDAPVAGVVLNAIDLSSPDYHYFTYGYSKGIDKRADERSDRPPSSPFSSGGNTQTKSKSAHA